MCYCKTNGRQKIHSPKRVSFRKTQQSREKIDKVIGTNDYKPCNVNGQQVTQEEAQLNSDQRKTN